MIDKLRYFFESFRYIYCVIWSKKKICQIIINQWMNECDTGVKCDFIIGLYVWLVFIDLFNSNEFIYTTTGFSVCLLCSEHLLLLLFIIIWIQKILFLWWRWRRRQQYVWHLWIFTIKKYDSIGSVLPHTVKHNHNNILDSPNKHTGIKNKKQKKKTTKCSIKNTTVVCFFFCLFQEKTSTQSDADEFKKKKILW